MTALRRMNKRITAGNRRLAQWRVKLVNLSLHSRLYYTSKYIMSLNSKGCTAARYVLSTYIAISSAKGQCTSQQPHGTSLCSTFFNIPFK